MPLPTLSVVLEGFQPILQRLSATEMKLAVRVSYEAGAGWWIVNYLTLRFTRYARAKLGYELRSSHIKRKKNHGAPDPLVWTGETRESVLKTARVVSGGTAEGPWVDIKMRTGGPRAKIVYEVLSTILDSEMPGVAKVIGEQLQAIVDQAISPSKRSKRLTLAGASSQLGSAAANVARAQHRTARGDRNDAVLDAGAARERFEAEQPARRARIQSRLKRTHDRWRRQSGGSAADGAASGMSATYRGSSRYRHAQAQARYRARYRR